MKSQIKKSQMKKTRLLNAMIVTIGLISALAGCSTSHKIEVVTEKPITINLNIELKVSKEVIALLKNERLAQQSQQPATSKGFDWKNNLSATPNLAESIDRLKQSQRIGEDREGYVSAVAADLRPQEVQMLAQIKSQRRQAYQKIAERNRTELALVEKIAGKNRIETAESGEMVMANSGQFVIKP